MTDSPLVRLWLCAACIAMTGGAGALAAEDASPAAHPAALLAPFLPDDAFALGYVDLSAIDPVAITDEVASIAGLPDAQRQEFRSQAQVAKAMLDGVRASGIRTAYVVIGLSDVSKVGGPLVIVDVTEPGDPEAAEGMLRGSVQLINQGFGSGKSKLHVERHASGVLLVGTKGTLQRYSSLTPVARPDLAVPLAQMAKDGAAVAIVFDPSPDFRRVVRELWPPAPKALALLKPLTGEFLADRFRYAELAIHTSPHILIRCTAQMSDPDAAEVAAQIIRDVPAVVDRATEECRTDELRAAIDPLSKLLAPEVDGTRTTLRIDSHGPGGASVLKLVALAHDEAINQSYRARRMENVKQFALAVLTYQDANKHFPSSAAIRDADGRPLLSWRVAILPYLEDADAAALYRLFHLDEPWDSPHNRELVKKMPAVFADPAHSELAQLGKTTYLVPVGPGTVFDTPEGVTFRDIKDGASKTIMIVTVAPDRAVEWTKPADWDVDIENPLNGLKQAGRDHFVAALCDGSVHVFPTSIDPAVLRAMLTRAGGEDVDLP